MTVDTNFILVLFGYVMTGMLAIVWWFYRGSVTRADECLRHLEKDLGSLVRELSDLRLQTTRADGELGARCGVLEGKLGALMTHVQDHGIELKNILPRVAVLEEEINGNLNRP